MAFSTGVAIGAQNLLSVLSTFMQANGWTLHDTITSNDLVFFSTGTDGNQNHYIRVTNEVRLLDFDAQTANFTVGQTVTGALSGATGVLLSQVDAGTTGTLTLIDTNGKFRDNETITDGLGGSATANGRLQYQTFKDPRVVNNNFDFLQVRAYTYWDAMTNTGINPQGQWGPLNINAPTNGLSTMFGQRTLNPSVFPAIFLEDAGAFGNGSGGIFATFDGVRRVHGFPSGGFYAGHRIFDIGAMPNNTTAVDSPFGVSGSQSGGVLVFDKANDRYFIYAMNSTATQADQWKRWNFDTNAWESLAGPNAYLYGRFAWDGDDFIYATFFNSTTFRRYQISTNAWTTLAVAPDNSTSAPGNGLCSGIFVPRGVIPAVTEDVIYFWLAGTTTTLYRYNVTSNTWSSPITLPEAISASGGAVWWDYNRYVYYHVGGAQTYVYRLDLQDIGGGWTSFTHFPSSPSTYVTMMHAAPMVANIKTRNGGAVTYYFIGDADSIKVVTKVGNNFYWSYFGKVTSNYKTNIATTTSPTTPGSPATVNVDSSAGFVVGDVVTILDPATGAVNTATITGVPSPTSLQMLVSVSLSTGSRIFIDAINCCLTGDSWLATFGYDLAGYQQQALASSYRTAPLADPRYSTRGGPSARQRIQLSPYNVFQNFPALSTLENRGSLLGVFALRNAAYPSPQPEDIVQDGNGNQYLVFSQRNATYTSDTRFIAIGPIN
jgi:hypothetical protein